METGPVTASRRSQALVSDPDDRDADYPGPLVNVANGPQPGRLVLVSIPDLPWRRDRALPCPDPSPEPDSCQT
jgi:hypothetical protein